MSKNGAIGSAPSARLALLRWCRKMTESYNSHNNITGDINEQHLDPINTTTIKQRNRVSIDNFSSSWSNGMAFCALLHHFMPDAFDFNALNPNDARYNFTLAFKLAE